jgi:hypothetical protein
MKVFQQWADAKFPLPDSNFIYKTGDLKPIPYQQLSLSRDWRTYPLHHELTGVGLARFMSDWQKITAS